MSFTDLNPPITYRTLHSPSINVHNPLRVIALCDSDAFYAACEMVRLNTPQDQPLVVLQWESIIAVNYPARKFGISRMDKVKDAKNRCPNLRVVHVATFKEGEKEPGYWEDVDTHSHKVSLDYYRRESLKIAARFKHALPGCEVEKASIDEAFIDFTKPVREIMLQRYPYLAHVPPDAPLGMDSPLPHPPPISWNNLGSVVPVNGDHHQEVLDVNDSSTTWHDVALSIAAELMEKAREDVRVNLGYSTSAGIARNKFLAKLIASYKKPNGQSILRNAAIPNYLIPLPFQKIRFLGGKLGTALAKEYDVSTVGDLLTVSLDDMQRKFGEHSIWVYEILRGIDRAEVKDKGTALNKSMLASKNLPKPIKKASEGYHWIRVLAAELALRLTDAREMSPNLWPKSIVLHARKGYEAGRSKQAPFPFTREITVDVIASAGDKLWKELVGKSESMNVTSVQLAFTGIDVAEPGQQTIEGFLKMGNTGKRPREEEEEDRQLNIGSGSHLPEDDSDKHFEGSDDQSLKLPTTSASSFTCSRCAKVITIQVPTDASGFDLALREEALVAKQLEHQDFHFAQDLEKEGDGASVSLSKTATVLKAKKRRTGPQGIEKFFSRK